MSRRKNETEEEYRERVKAVKRAYYAAHRDEIRDKRRTYYEATEEYKEKARARTRAYREAHAEEVKAKKKAYYESHKEEKKAYDKAYYKFWHRRYRPRCTKPSTLAAVARNNHEKAMQEHYAMLASFGISSFE